MAKVDGPAMSIRASGNVGPLCYSIWRGMQIARAAWSGTQTSTSAQLVIRGYYTTVVQAWGGALTEAQRQMWRDYARTCRWVNTLGLDWIPSGYQVFVKMGLQSLILGSSYQVEPPEELVGAHPGSVVVYRPGVDEMIEVSMSDWADGIEPDVIQIWRAGPYVSGGYHAQKQEFRVVQVQGPPFVWQDWGVVSENYYWYRVRWGFNIGIVGNFWEEQVWVEEIPPP